MAETRLSKRTFTWAPKALAVISCALALLAAQPALGGASTARKGAVVVREGGMVDAEWMEGAAAVRVRSAARETARATGRHDATLLSRAKQWRILATMEILHRLLVGEMRGAERQVLPVVWFEEVCMAVAGKPAGFAGRVAAAGAEIPIAERVFAIRHCLLAPPIS